MTRVPSNHRQAERRLVRLVRSGEWSIDRKGQVWRMRLWNGKVIEPRRAEHDTGSYLMVRAMRDGVRVVGAAHRLVFHHFFGVIPDGLVLNHLNGVKHDNRPENLEAVTASQNSLHASRVLGVYRDQRGLKNHRAALTPAQVIDMRTLRADGAPLTELAARHDTSIGTVSKIVRGERWRHVGGPITRAEDGEGWRARSAANRERDAAGRFLGA